jgi:hypothetical protein
MAPIKWKITKKLIVGVLGIISFNFTISKYTKLNFGEKFYKMQFFSPFGPLHAT